jgi:hypothetical protein
MQFSSRPRSLHDYQLRIDHAQLLKLAPSYRHSFLEPSPVEKNVVVLPVAVK